jgi:flagellar biosynthesis protein FlhF
MELKTYHGNSMAEALEKVKKELGREAVILHTRSVRRGGWMGFGGRTLVEITAARDVNVLHPAERRAMLGREGGRERVAAAGRPSPAAGRPPQPPTTSAPTAAVGAAVLDRPAPREAEAFSAGLRGEMGELRAMVRELLSRSFPANGSPSADRPPEIPSELQQYYTALIQNEVAEEVAREVLSEARERLEQLHTQAGTRAAAIGLEQLVPAVMLETIERMLPAAQPVQLGEGATRYVALVGPTGVGKTTTIAKLAAHFKLREGKRVGMITIDTYRIAAVEQLRAYAQILEIPLETVLAPEDMGPALQRLSGLDLVLIDTSGRSQKDHKRLDELKLFLDAARGEGSGGGLETHLVLSCTANPNQLAEVAERFSLLGVDRVVFTKLDEAVGVGVILNCVRRLKLQLSYLTTGQDVPDDIEVGHRRRIAQLVLNGNAPAVEPKAKATVDVQV